MADEVRCQQCVNEGERSRVNVPAYGASTAMYCAPYYDEDGRYHNHDLNTHTEKWSCSRGHSWVVTTSPSCPAGDYPGTHEVRFV